MVRGAHAESGDLCGLPPAGIGQAAQRFQPLPGDVGGERFAGDAALQLGGRGLAG